MNKSTRLIGSLCLGAGLMLGTSAMSANACEINTGYFGNVAINQCGGSYKTLSGGAETAGYYTHTSFDNGNAYSTTTPIGMTCFVYQCNLVDLENVTKHLKGSVTLIR